MSATVMSTTASRNQIDGAVAEIGATSRGAEVILRTHRRSNRELSMSPASHPGRTRD